MRQRHEISPAWRGAPWDKRVAEDWDERPVAEPMAERPWHALALAALLGMALGATVVQGLARQDRTRLDALMAAVRAGA